MKTISVSLLLIMLTLASTAQEISPIKKWSFGVELFPNVTFEILKSDGTAPTTSEAFYRDLEKPKFCLSGQVYATYMLNSKMSVSFGLGYQNTGNQTKYQDLSWVAPGTSFDPAIPNKVKYVYDHHNIQVPVFYSYNFTKRFYARGGFSTLFNFSNTVTQVLQDFNGNKSRSTNEDMSIPEFRTLNFSGNLGFGYTFYSSSRFKLYAQTNIESAMLQLKKGAPLNRRPVSIGLILGARF
ncbi:MAG: outer membrane beta-barrel protein [Flavobacteriales bacterium]